MLCSSFFQMDLCGSIGATYSEVVEGAEGVWLLGQVLILAHLVLNMIFVMMLVTIILPHLILRGAFRNPSHRMFARNFF